MTTDVHGHLAIMLELRVNIQIVQIAPDMEVPDLIYTHISPEFLLLLIMPPVRSKCSFIRRKWRISGVYVQVL